MSRSAERGCPLAALALLLAGTATASESFEGIGRSATPAEIAAWDIDVRPDFAGLPPGQGSVAEGEMLWIEKCTSCHGDFGDANHVYPPLIGNTTLEDIESGRVAALRDPGRTRTTIMKMPTVSTLWDFINRAMPWDKPKSLSPDEVYAVLAYLLNLADIVPADFTLSHENIAWVQSRMPNRNGMTRDHGMWEIDGRPDTRNTACMRNCKVEPEPSSELPDFARDAHGELLKQNREYGAIRGTRTTDQPMHPEASISQAPNELLTRNACLGCHGIEAKLVGPGFREVHARYRDQSDAASHLVQRISSGGSGIWGQLPMPPQPQLEQAQIEQIVQWILAGAPE